MPIPTDKSASMDAFLADFFGVDRNEAILTAKCTGCKGPASNFRDELSRREYEISGLCQKCQDEIFNPDKTTDDEETD